MNECLHKSWFIDMFLHLSITKLTRLCVPYLEDTKGAVVNVSSFGSQQAVSFCSFYKKYFL
jgi:short-subunit dehydrogenase